LAEYENCVEEQEELLAQAATVSCQNPPSPSTQNQAFTVWVNQCHQGSSIPLETTDGQPLNVPPCDTENFANLTGVFGGKNVYIHESLHPSINRISNRWEDIGGQAAYPINTIGGYNCRWLTGQTDTLSNHAYGLALDVNSNTNPYIENLSSIGSRSDYTDMPEWFVQLWRDEGYGWGGDWQSKKDAMHFSKIEGG